MLINHDITLDILTPGPTPRIQVKQGDSFSRNIRIALTENGQPWLIPDGAEAVIRYRAHDPETLTDTSGIFDLLEDGTCAYIYGDNIFEIMPANALMAVPGLVTLDVVFLYGDRTLATFDFEIYVNRAPVSGTTPGSPVGNFYRIANLEQINGEFDKLRAAIEALGGSIEG